MSKKENDLKASPFKKRKPEIVNDYDEQEAFSFSFDHLPEPEDQFTGVKKKKK